MTGTADQENAPRLNKDGSVRKTPVRSPMNKVIGKMIQVLVVAYGCTEDTAENLLAEVIWNERMPIFNQIRVLLDGIKTPTEV